MRYATGLISLTVLASGCASTNLPETRSAIPAVKVSAADDLRANSRSILRMGGVWKGTFRRYDAEGVLTETLPSEIHIRFPNDGGPHQYHQTNILKRPDGSEQRIETFGIWDGKVLRFSSARIDGWFTELEPDDSGLNSVLSMTFKDGSGMNMSEIITLSPDGTRRMRAAQYSVYGKLVRRTLIDEVRSTP